MLNGLVIGGVSVLIGADASGLAKGAKNAEDRMKQLERTTSNIVHRMKTAFLALAGPAAIGALTKSSLDVIDAQSKLSRQLGGSLPAIQTLIRSADLAGISQDELAGAMGRLNRKIGEAMRDGLSPAADAFKKLGLSAKDLSGMDVDQRMIVIGNALQKAGYNAQQTADWLGQIGIRGGKFAAIFEGGAEGIAEAKKELDAFGVTMSSIDGQQIEIANDAMTIFGVAVRGLGNRLALTASVIMPKVAKAFKDWGMEGEGAGKMWEKVIDEIVVGLGVIPTIVHTVRVAWDGLMDFMVGSLNIFASAWDNTLGKLLFPIGQIKNDWGNASKTLAQPPNMEQWRAMWANMRKEAYETAKAQQAALGTGTGGDSTGLSSREAKAMQEKIDALKKSVAAEDEILRLQRDKNLKDLQEFEQAKQITVADANKVRAQIEADFNEKMDKLKYDKFGRDIMTENEQLAYKHEQQLALLKQFQDNQTYTTEEAERIRAGIEDKYRQKRLQNMASDWSSIASIVDTAMGAISGIMEDEGEKGFTVMKAIGMATALVKGFEASVSAYAHGAAIGGPALGASMAAIAAAGTAAIIAKMAGVGPKSKGTPTSGGGGGGGGGRGNQQSEASSAVSPQRSMVVSGFNPQEWMRGDMVRDVAKQLVQFQEDGGKVFIK